MSVALRPHQEEAINEMHNGCVLAGGVGVGKTITSLAYYFTEVCGGELNQWGSMKTPKDVYVITTAKVRDSMAFELQAAAMGIHADRALSTNGVKITVDSWNNLHKHVETKNAFFIFDEQRVVGYGAWARAFIKIARNNEWVLLSATPGDTWMDYIPVFIANGFYKHKTDFLDQHVIWTPRVKYPKVLRYQNVGKLVRHRNSILVHMPYERHTKRHSIVVPVDYDEDTLNKVVKKKWHVYEERPLRDAGELFGVMRKVVNSDPSRLSAVQSLMERHPKLIVFYNFDYELEDLRTLAEQYTRTTPSSSHQEDDWQYLLSPEGMEANSHNVASPSLSTTSSSSSKATSTSASNRGSASGSVSTGRVVADGVGSKQRLKDTISPTPEVIESVGTIGVKHADALSSSSAKSADFAVAEWNGHKHEPIPATARWVYLVQYRAGAEGWNCIETDAICFYSQTYSYRDWWQAHGRIDRLNTPYTDLYYYNLMSKALIDKAIRAALRVKKNFNERDLKI